MVISVGAGEEVDGRNALQEEAGMVTGADATGGGLHLQVAHQHTRHFLPRRRRAHPVDTDGTGAVQAAHHVQVDHVVEFRDRHRGVLGPVVRSIQPLLLAAEGDEEVVVRAGLIHLGQVTRQLHHHGDPAGIVIGPVVDGPLSAVQGTFVAPAQVVQVCTDHHHIGGTVVQQAHHVVARALLADDVHVDHTGVVVDQQVLVVFAGEEHGRHGQGQHLGRKGGLRGRRVLVIVVEHDADRPQRDHFLGACLQVLVGEVLAVRVGAIRRTDGDGGDAVGEHQVLQVLVLQFGCLDGIAHLVDLPACGTRGGEWHGEELLALLQFPAAQLHGVHRAQHRLCLEGEGLQIARLVAVGHQAHVTEFPGDIVHRQLLTRHAGLTPFKQVAGQVLHVVLHLVLGIGVGHQLGACQKGCAKAGDQQRTEEHVHDGCEDTEGPYLRWTGPRWYDADMTHHP